MPRLAEDSRNLPSAHYDVIAFWRVAKIGVLFALYPGRYPKESMSSEIMHQIVEPIEAEARSRPSAIEFEMAYQARVVIDRIKFAIKHTEQFSRPCIHMREAGLQLLDALDRLESLDRRFQIRSRIAAGGDRDAADDRG
jgi:hypothetical protein